MRSIMKDCIIQYWNSGANGYNKGVQRLLHSHKENSGWKSVFSEYLNEKPLKVLDVGTGPGSMSILLAEMGHFVSAVDLSEQMLHCARENAKECNVTVDFKVGDAENLPFEDNSFDAVVNRWVLWTVPNPKAALSEWTRVLKPGGRLLIFDGNWYSGEKTCVQKAWKHGSRFYTLLSERRNMWKRDMDNTFVDGLWSTHAKRPEDDCTLFRNAGLINVESSLDLNKKVYTLSDYLRQGYWGDTFIVTGVKPDGTEK